MGRSLGPFVPIGVAVLATAGIGAYMNRPQRDEPSRLYHPKPKWKKLELRLIRSGSDAPNPKPRWWPASAAWVEYEALADGKPTDQVVMRLVAHDEKGNAWPVAPYREKGRMFAVIPAYHPVRARKLTIEAFERGNPIAKWELSKIGPPLPRKPPTRDERDLAKDYPGYQPIFEARPLSDSGFAALSLKNYKLNDATSVQITGLPYGPNGEVPRALPSYFYEHFGWLEISTLKQIPFAPSQETVVLDHLPIRVIAGRRQVVLSNRRDVPLKDGSVLILTPLVMRDIQGFSAGVAGPKSIAVFLKSVSGPTLADPAVNFGTYAFKAPLDGAETSVELTVSYQKSQTLWKEYRVPFKFSTSVVGTLRVH